MVVKTTLNLASSFISSAGWSGVKFDIKPFPNCTYGHTSLQTGQTDVHTCIQVYSWTFNNGWENPFGRMLAS